MARTGSIGRAAAEHGVSQPAASARMRLLEGQLGLALIERSPRGSKLTPAGALVAGWAQAAVDAAESLDAGLTALRRERDSRLRIAASMTVAEYLLPAWLTALRAVDPGAVVALSAVNSAEVAQALLADAADIGFVEGPGVPDGLHAEPVGRDALTLVVAPAHPWARRRSAASRPPSSRGPRWSAGRPGRAPGATWRRRCAPRPAWSAWRLGRRAVLHHRDQGRGRGRGRPGRAQLAGRRARTRRRDAAPVPVTGVDLTRTLRAVWTEGRRLTGPALDLYAIATRSAHPRGRRLLPDEPGARRLAGSDGPSCRGNPRGPATREF